MALSDATERYARVLDLGTRVGFIALLVTFGLYVFGVIPAAIALNELPRLWSLPVDEFVRASGGVTGWGWVARLHQGDYLNYVGVVFLALVTVVCYAVVVPQLWRDRARVFAWFAIAEIAVLVVAAIGFGAGHG